MPKDQVPEQVRKAQNKVQDTYEDSRGRNYDIRQVVKGNERLVTATGMIRDALLKTCEIKKRDTMLKHIEAQGILFHLITLYAWAVLKNNYGCSLNMECAEQAIARATAQVYEWVLDGNRNPDYRMYTRTSITVNSRYLDAIHTLHPENIGLTNDEGKNIDVPVQDDDYLLDVREQIESIILRLRDQDKLTERQKVVLCYKFGLCNHELIEKQSDIAEKLGISNAAVSNALQKALTIIQETVKKEQ